eukprot:scaffold2458_cov121-Isochrysis_galbana.AAC.10
MARGPLTICASACSACAASCSGRMLWLHGGTHPASRRSRHTSANMLRTELLSTGKGASSLLLAPDAR